MIFKISCRNDFCDRVKGRQGSDCRHVIGETYALPWISIAFVVDTYIDFCRTKLNDKFICPNGAAVSPRPAVGISLEDSDCTTTRHSSFHIPDLDKKPDSWPPGAVIEALSLKIPRSGQGRVAKRGKASLSSTVPRLAEPESITHSPRTSFTSTRSASLAAKPSP